MTLKQTFKPITVYLHPDQAEALRVAAFMNKQTQSDIVRIAIDSHLSKSI